jgi:hypothetical protein
VVYVELERIQFAEDTNTEGAFVNTVLIVKNGVVWHVKIRGLIYIYCDGPLLHNERLPTDVISTVTDTENYPMTRNS